MKLGIGYYTPWLIRERLESAKIRGNALRVRWLSGLLREVEALPQSSRLINGWRSAEVRNRRIAKMQAMRETMTLEQVGNRFGISRERVRQLLSGKSKT